MDVTDILGFEMTELLGGTLPSVQLDDLLVSSHAISTTGSLTDLPMTSPIEQEKPATTETASPITKAPLVGLESMPTAILPLGVYEAEYLLRNAQTRDGVLELGLYFFATKLQHAALFLLRKQSAKGLRMIGPADLDKAFQDIEISLDASAFFSAMLNALVPYSGSPSEEEADRPLFSLFSQPPKHVYLLPVRVRGRTVALLYGDTLQDALSHEEFEQLIRCTYQMAQSLEHVILAVKKGVTEESAAVTQALDALRKHDDLALRSVLQNGRNEINAIEAESLAAIERVQSEEKRIAHERAEKLARSAELARAAREQAAIAASQSSQTTDFLDATANPPDIQTSTDAHSLNSQTGDFADPRASVPVTQTGDFAAAPAPVTQTGDFAQTSVSTPVTQTGDFAQTSVSTPVTQTGDFAQTSAPPQATAAYLDAFVVDDETRKRFTSQTQPITEEKKKVASEQSPYSVPSEKNAEPATLQTTEPNTTPSQEKLDTQTQPPTLSPQADSPQTPPASSESSAPSDTPAETSEPSAPFESSDPSESSAPSESSDPSESSAPSEPSTLSETSASSDTPTSSETSDIPSKTSDAPTSSETSDHPNTSASPETTQSLEQAITSSKTEAEAFPELMPAFDDAPRPAKEARSADVIGAEIASSGDGDGAEISSNAANPNPSQGNADTLLAALLSENTALSNLAQEAEALGTPTPSQQEIQALTERPQEDDRAEDSPRTQPPEASDTFDLSFLLTGTLHAPPALPPVSEEVAVLLPMLDDENERMREVALQSFRDLPHDRSIAALLYAIFQQLRPEDILDDGQLSADKQQRPIHTLYQLLIHHKEAASTALCHQLYHLTPEQNTLALRILPHLPLSRSVWPHLMHFVLRLDEHLAKPSLALLEQHKEDPTLQEIAAYLRDQITTEQPDYGARVLRLLQKLHTPEITKATRRFLHVQEPQIAEMAARLTLLSLREQANQDTLPTAPPTPRALSIDHIFSSDLEDPPALPAPDPILHEIVKLLSLPGDTLHREAILVLRDMPPQRLTHTLLHHYPGNLELSDFNTDGDLDPQKQKTPDGYIWLLLCQTPESTQGHLLPHLAHKQPRIRLLTLQLLQIFPSLDPLLPYLFRYLLDFNALIVEACRKLLRQANHSMAFQRILEWMREQLEFSDPTQAIRAVKVLAVLRDTVAVPSLIELVQHEDRELAEAATQALQLITKQILPAQHKPWSKWWNKVGSHSERVDWLIEAIQTKDEAIIQAANQELIELTGQDFGLSSETGRKERNNVIQQWKTWRKQHPIF